MLYLDNQNVYNFKSAGQDNIVRAKNPDEAFRRQSMELPMCLKVLKIPRELFCQQWVLWLNFNNEKNFN
jgi:hypothetical protein